MAKDFVCVRIQSMNGMNINLFQFEYDLTWMAFFMNAKDQTYARYGGREDAGPETHLTKASLVRVMRRVCTLHRGSDVKPQSKYEPSGKPPRTPEDIPTMKRMLAKRKNKCIHCHDVKVAELRHEQDLGRFTREMVFTYPTPANLGLKIDADTQTKILSVMKKSPAEKAGLRVGDELITAAGQRVLTFADFSRVLELTAKPIPGEPKDQTTATLPVEFRRGGRTGRATLTLSGKWRRSQDPSWRESLHVAGPNGGFWGRKANDRERRQNKIPADTLALRVTFIWGAHTRRAGIRIGDVVVALGDVRREMTIRQFHAHLNLNTNYGDTVPIVVRRGGEEVKLMMKLPERPPR